MNLKTTQQDHDSRADEEASLWAARLEGSTLSAADRDALDSWLAENPANRAALARYCQFSADLEQQIGALASAGLVEMPGSRSGAREDFVRRSSVFRSWIFAGSLAAAAALVVVFSVVSSHSAATDLGTPYATAVGQQQTVTLADGSTVEMNAQTRFTFVSTPRERRVRLSSGEAFFSVAKLTPVVPFYVESAAGTVRVTGTHFAVRAESATDLEVTVEEGSVEVTPSAVSGGTSLNARDLRANDRLIARAGAVDVKHLSADDLDHSLSWRKGMVLFDQTPLIEAAARFARFNGQIINVAPSIQQKGVGGSYDLKDLDGFLHAGSDIGFKVRIGADKTITLEAP